MPFPSSFSTQGAMQQVHHPANAAHTSILHATHPAPWLNSSALGSREPLLSSSANASAASLASLFRTSCCSLCLMGSNLALNLHHTEA